MSHIRGRFKKEADRLVEDYTTSLPFDWRLYPYDIAGSIAHARMLAKQGIITDKDAETIVNGLTAIQREIEGGEFQFKGELEDIHMNIEARLLEKKGFGVSTASGGAEALEKLAASPVHVVILDVKMPGMDGVATLRQIKQRFPMVEVIMLTGHATVESAIEGLKAGATDYLMKPADLDDIIAKAKEAYARREDIEEKIRVARMRGMMKSPREILQNA